MAEINLDDDDGVMDSASMAEAMGFSGFGMQRPPSKKRKFNPHADAAVASSNHNNKRVSPTGANSAPLGQKVMRLPPPSVAEKTGTDEIDLGGDDIDNAGDKDDEAVNPDDPDSRYIDTSRPSRGYFPEELAEMEAQQRIDAILANSTSPGLPARPPPAAGDGNFNQHGSHHHGNQRGRGNKSARNHQHSGKSWWEGYYDPTTNQNPWEVLEKKLGMQPRGKWLPKDATKLATERQKTVDIIAPAIEEKEKAGEGNADEIPLED